MACWTAYIQVSAPQLETRLTFGWFIERCPFIACLMVLELATGYSSQEPEYSPSLRMSEKGPMSAILEIPYSIGLMGSVEFLFSKRTMERRAASRVRGICSVVRFL